MAVDDEGARLVLLQQCHDEMELALLKSLLDGEHIAYLAQGEHHASVFSGRQQMILTQPRLLVASRDYERACELLAAVPQLQAETTEVSLADAVCPVHEQPAVATCDRCGTFLCTACTALGNPPLCEECLEHEARGLNQSETKRPANMLAPVFTLAAIIAAALLVAYIVRGG